MDALWITLAMVLAVVGGWPVTAGILKLAKSQTIRAVDAAESGEAVVEPTEGEPATVEESPSGIPLAADAATPAGPDTDAGTPAGPDTDATTPAGPDVGSGGEGSRADGGRDAPARAAPARPGGEVLRGGLLIGFLERGAVAVAIFSGQPVAIAYVVAIKGLGRYPELKETPGASERFIIGTLASMLWAASVGVLTKVLLL
ncbi:MULTISPECIES: hypothetical protein [Arthrobacter]|uniref:hypothetical protein n=1 Tax=Arthrobacter TaxID=1663 RepID=UPI000535F5BE|nr:MULTISPECIES: hypothetical protein [Arthrobacter]AIY03841.1 hypothetical protein ART_4242 [Arthrobacter sp. PAMC 25486]